MEGEDNMKTGLLRGGVLIATTLVLAACGQREVSYKADVQPILKQYCLECHTEGGKGTEKSGLLMTSYESLMKGTKFGSIIKPNFWYLDKDAAVALTPNLAASLITSAALIKPSKISLSTIITTTAFFHINILIKLYLN